jgi:hypothetical protein
MKPYSTGGFGMISLPEDMVSAQDYPPQRNVIPAAKIPQLGIGVASPLIQLQDYCGWLYLEADGGADIYVAPSRNGGGFITRLLAGKPLWIEDGCFRLYYGVNAPTAGVQVLGCTGRDASVLALGGVGVTGPGGITPGPIPGSTGQTTVNGPFAVDSESPAVGPAGAPGFASSITVNSGGPVYVAQTAAALALDGGDNATAGQEVAAGGSIPWNGNAFFGIPNGGLDASVTVTTG